MSSQAYPIQRAGGRKFVAAMFACACATGLMAFGQISDTVWGWVVVATIGAYITGNVSQRVFERTEP